MFNGWSKEICQARTNTNMHQLLGTAMSNVGVPQEVTPCRLNAKDLLPLLSSSASHRVASHNPRLRRHPKGCWALRLTALIFQQQLGFMAGPMASLDACTELESHRVICLLCAQIFVHTSVWYMHATPLCALGNGSAGLPLQPPAKALKQLAQVGWPALSSAPSC